MSVGTRKGALIFGLILILIGLAFLLSNWYPNLTMWRLIVRYWPLFLVLIGLAKLYGYFSYVEEPPVEGAQPKRRRSHRPSLMAGLLWTGFGILFQLRNLGIGPDLWAMARRYWPILLILLGLGKVIDYYRKKEGVSIRIGEVFGLFFVVIIALAISEIPGSALRDMFSFHIGGSEMFIGTSHEYSQDYTQPLAAGMPVHIENSSGQVSVSEGSDNEIRVHLRKIVYEDDGTRARQIAGEIKVQGGEIGKAPALTYVVKTNRDDLSAANYHYKTDMEVYVPKNVQLEIRNSFGGVTVSGLNCKLDAQSSQQTIDVHDCTGSFKIANMYGNSKLSDLTGNVSVNTRGDVEVSTIKGDVDVRDEFSEVRIRDVEGAVTVSNEGSSVSVDNVSKPVAIDARGSRVTATNLRDSLKINGSHQRIQVSDVTSNVTLASSYSPSVSLKSIKGNVDITFNSDRITLDDIGGYVKAVGQGSSVRVNTVSGPVDINTTMKDVVVNDFNKGCVITNEFGDVTLSTDSLSTDKVSVKGRNGDITLFLPAAAAFTLDAVTRNGHITSEFAGLEPVASAGDVTTMRGKSKSGGPLIVLETENKDIYLRCRDSEQRSRKER